MPRISFFYGISIYMFFDDHLPPHFHARYAEYDASIAIMTLETLKGRLPGRARSLVLDWADRHRVELLANWERARASMPLDVIEPLS